MVLVALAVIFIPMLLQGPVEREATSIPMEIPPQPQVSATAPSATVEAPAYGTVANPFTPAEPVAPIAQPRPQAEPAAPVDTHKPAAQQAPPPAPVQANEPAPAQSPRTPAELAAWAVQVGSFGTEANALGLRDSLRSKGYKAYTERIHSNGKTFYRVRVGPTLARAEAERLQAELARKESLQGLVVPHP